MLHKLFFMAISLLIISACGCAQGGGNSGGFSALKGNGIAVCFYNCENFFDPVHNPAKEDDEFTPEGKYHYTQFAICSFRPNSFSKKSPKGFNMNSHR